MTVNSLENGRFFSCKNAVLLHEMPRLLLPLSLLFAIVDCNCQICLCFVVFNVVGQHPHHFISSYTRVFVSQIRKERERERPSIPPGYISVNEKHI